MKVRFTRPAQQDLARIYAYISQDSPTVASRFVTRLMEHARQIGDHPFAGRETDEPDVRVLIVARLRYFIFYTIEDNEVRITHIRHTSRRRPRGRGQ
jgi:toxin ParE1/3/4